MFDDCETLDDSDCDNCASGDVGCDVPDCFIDDLRYIFSNMKYAASKTVILHTGSCIGVEVDVLNGVESAEDCLEQCQDEDHCQWATYLVQKKDIFLFNICVERSLS